MEFTELPQIRCPQCERTSNEDEDLREGSEFNCSRCKARLLVVFHETVVRVVCEVVLNPIEE